MNMLTFLYGKWTQKEVKYVLVDSKQFEELVFCNHKLFKGMLLPSSNFIGNLTNNARNE